MTATLLSIDGKVCTKCKELKNFSEFYKASGKSSKINPVGRKSHCKDCISAQRKEYYSTPKGYKYSIEKAWRDKGIYFTIEQYQEMLESQNNGCAICGVPHNKNRTALCLDHDHVTGKIRGILCHMCNTALGRFSDSKDLLLKACNYLEERI